MVRVYVKVQCGGFVLRLGEEEERENRLSLFPDLKPGTRDTRPIVTVISLTLLRRVVRRCRQVLSTGTSSIIIICTRQRQTPL